MQSAGVMKIMEVTPFIPLTLRGKCKERALTLRGNLGRALSLKERFKREKP